MRQFHFSTPRQLVLAVTAVVVLAAGGFTLAVVAPSGAHAGDSLTTAQIKKLIKKEAAKQAKKHPGPQGPAGPAGPTGTGWTDTISTRATFGQSGLTVYARNGMTVLLNCSASGILAVRTTSDNAAVGAQGLASISGVIGGFNGDFDSGAINEVKLNPTGESTTGSVVYTPSGGSPVTIVYALQFNTAQDNCIVSGSASY
jgi:hypothetical protein